MQRTYAGDGPAKDLFDRVEQHPSATARLLTDRTPLRVRVWCGPEIPDGVQDLIDMYDAEITDPTVEQGGLRIDLVVREPFRDMGEKAIRKWGTSHAVSLSHATLDASGFEIGDPIDIDARRGEIRIREGGTIYRPDDDDAEEN